MGTLKDRTSAYQFLTAVDVALELLQNHAKSDLSTLAPDPLPSLLEQCSRMIAEARPSPVRTLHHFACTGGTLIAKCLAALPNSLLLSEIDPLSTLTYCPQTPWFAPTDVVLNSRYAFRSQDEEMLLEIFRAEFLALRAAADRKGQNLILRDHAHSQFCTDRDPASRSTLREILRDICQPDIPMLSVVTLRDPVDSFLSLRRNGWQTGMVPFTIEEYSRRYLAFLDRYRGCPMLRYEDLIDDPVVWLTDLCRRLDLPFSADAIDLFPIIRLSGDSGRSGGSLERRPRQEIPDPLKAEIADSASLHTLAATMGYEIRK